MDNLDMENRERQLAALFQAYRASVPNPEASARFMPVLWERIDARRKFSFRLAKAFVTAAAALSLLLGAFLASPALRDSLVYSASYVDVLDENHSTEAMAYADVHPDLGGDVTNQ
jgi:hypothetical protein